MASPSVLIENPQGNNGNRIRLNRARRYEKRGRAMWVIQDKVLRFIEPGSAPGPRSMRPAQFIITPEMRRSIDLRASLPMWPTIEEVKAREK